MLKNPLDILREYWGYERFRPMQEEIIQSVIGRQDTLALLPTGGGKSICFQVPGLVFEGLTLVISPLIALMKDQVERLIQLGIPSAYIHGGMTTQEIDEKLQAAMDGAFAFLYIAPERIPSEMFRMRLPSMQVNLLVVDEAHCISQWGYDFRPSYLEIPLIREILPKIPIIAVTASATLQVREDIAARLGLREPAVFSKSFRRENLRYFVIDEQNVNSRVQEICRRTQGTGIVYARTRKRATTVAAALKEAGLSAAAYHGGMPTSQRNEVQQSWMEGKIRIMVSTNAFGMGIDKPDVRFVIHYNLPLDLESYYQEAGRGGRDGKTALAIAFNNPIDIAEAQRWASTKYPTWEEVERHYHFLCSHFNLPHTGTVFLRVPFDIQELSSLSGEPVLRLYNSVKLLDREGLLQLQEDKDDYGQIRILAKPDDILIYGTHNPQEAAVLDHALRRLGGEIFNFEMRFLPGNWANRLGIEPGKMQSLLQRLVQHEMITYQPPAGTPMIVFTKPRQRLSKPGLNWEKYEFLRHQTLVRFDELKQYVTTKEACRSLLIQHYFGEKTHEPCGKCDVCIGRHKTKVSDHEFQGLKDSIISYIREHQPTYREVLTHIGAGTPPQREKVLRYLMDKKVILSDRLGNLRLR